MMIRKDKPINKAYVLTKLLRVIFFSLATVAFVAAGMQGNDIKTWLIAFVGSYGTAAIYSFVVKLIVTLAKKDQ